ncbi:SDR family oxidoreductase [Methanospirillum sp.]
MKVVITGGAGFIGSHLAEGLIQHGDHVIILDNLSNGKLENISNLLKNPHCTFIQTDISDNTQISKYFSDIDYVFHLAALADIVPSIQEPLKYHHSNVNGTISVLEAARKADVKKFIYAASSSCYGIPDMYPTRETAPIRPMYPYALTKYLGEQYVMHWNQTYDLPCISLRMFNVYGPRSRTSGTYGAVFGVFLAQKIAGKPFTVVGDGTQTRDFTYVTDVVDAFNKAAESDIRGEIYNVGSGGTYSVNRLVEQLGGDVEYIPKRPGEPDCTFADTTKIQRELNWKPKVTFEEGVQKMLESIDLWKDAPIWDAQGIDSATKDWFKYLGKEE